MLFGNRQMFFSHGGGFDFGQGRNPSASSSFPYQRDYSYRAQNEHVAPPLLDDIFFGVPITQKIKNAYNGLKSKVSKGLSYFKGVSAGGEEFTNKLDKLLAAANA
jgi:hypothetical protein